MKVFGAVLDPLTVVYMAFNFLVSVGIVFCNKFIFHHYHFDYATLMTCLHFLGRSYHRYRLDASHMIYLSRVRGLHMHAVTWAGVLVNLRMGQYSVKELNHMDVFPITLSFCA